MYRDPRGTLYHPHTGEDIPLGTLAVEEYGRPAWTFNKVLYIEKEGFFEILKSVKWPERHDCALLTSKGYATRAVRDLLDMLADDDEPLTVFCVHDADASGTMIYQSLQEATKARPRRRIEIINLGLEPWEAVAMGLEIEDIEAPKDRRPVAAYAQRSQRMESGERVDWADFLQRRRIELNAMTTPQFLEWLDQKMADHGDRKVIPPEDVMAARLRSETESGLRSIITEKVLREAKVDDQVEAALSRVRWPNGRKLAGTVETWLGDRRDHHWPRPIESVAAELVRGAA